MGKCGFVAGLVGPREERAVCVGQGSRNGLGWGGPSPSQPSSFEDQLGETQEMRRQAENIKVCKQEKIVNRLILKGRARVGKYFNAVSACANV